MSYIGNAAGIQSSGYVLLSGSTNGIPIAITATSATNAQTIHTSNSLARDFVNLYAHNPTSSVITLQVGMGTTATAQAMTYSIPAQDGLYLALPGTPLTGSAAVTAWSSATGGVNLSGLVQRNW